MKNKNIFKTVLTGVMICGLTTILVAKMLWMYWINLGLPAEHLCL